MPHCKKIQKFSKFSYSENFRYTHYSHHLEKQAKLREVDQLTANIMFINDNILQQSACRIVQWYIDMI